MWFFYFTIYNYLSFKDELETNLLIYSSKIYYPLNYYYIASPSSLTKRCSKSKKMWKYLIMSFNQLRKKDITKRIWDPHNCRIHLNKSKWFYSLSVHVHFQCSKALGLFFLIIFFLFSAFNLITKFSPCF